MSTSNFKTGALRFIWATVPWLMVALILAFVINMYARIKEEKVRLTEAKKEAIRKQVPAVRVITMTLEPGRLEDKINLPAEVQPYKDVWVKAEVRGQVVEVLVQEGQTVKTGQVLIKLDDRDYRTRLARIEANYKLARQNHDRITALIKKKLTATANLDEIEARLSDLTAQRSEARLALSRARITSPICCLLNEIKAKQGDFVGMGDPVAQILQLDQVKVIVGVPESDVAAFFELDEAEMVIEALDKRRVKGRKVFLSRQPRTLARLYDLELIVPNPDGLILPGMFARVELVKRVFDRALTIPLYAVISQGDERIVFVEKEGRAERRSIVPGALVGWQVQVTSGLAAGERVVVVGHRLLNDGQPVEVIKNVSDLSEILKP